MVKVIKIQTPVVLKLRRIVEPRFIIGISNQNDLRLDIILENVPEYKHDILVLSLLTYKREIESKIAGITYTYKHYRVIDIKGIITTVEVEYE